MNPILRHLCIASTLSAATAFAIIAIAPFAQADDTPSRWRADASLAFGIHQEQVKNGAGESGGRLFQNVTGATMFSGSYAPLEWLDMGAFFMFELGVRSAAEYGGLNGSGVPTTLTRAGGHYNMYWHGPLLRPHWKNLFVEIGYIALGYREDGAYPGLVAPGGSTDNAFRTDPLKAWLIAPGMTTTLTKNLLLSLKVEYRYLYYNRRGGRLAADQLYGTQAIRPHIGLAYNF